MGDCIQKKIMWYFKKQKLRFELILDMLLRKNPEIYLYLHCNTNHEFTHTSLIFSTKEYQLVLSCEESSAH